MIARALEAEILRLHHTEHWPVGTIARQLRVHHSTVRRVLAQAGVALAPREAQPERKRRNGAAAPRRALGRIGGSTDGKLVRRAGWPGHQSNLHPDREEGNR